MKTNQSRRSVLLALMFAKRSDAPSVSKSIEDVRVAKISALFADGKDVTVDRFESSDEAALLRRFWRSLRPNDRIFARNANRDFEILRRRSWLLDVVPARDIDLRSIYGIELWDTDRMWTSGYTPCPIFVTEPQIEPKEIFIPEFQITFHPESNSEVTVHCRD